MVGSDMHFQNSILLMASFLNFIDHSDTCAKSIPGLTARHLRHLEEFLELEAVIASSVA